MNKKIVYVIVILLIVAGALVFYSQRKEKQLASKPAPAVAAQIKADKEIEGDERAQIFPGK